MKHLFAARFKMLEACINTAESHAVAWNNTPGFSMPFEDLKGIREKLVDVMPMLTQKTRGETFAKRELRKKVADDTLRLSFALTAYAKSSGNGSLRKDAYLTVSTLQIAADTVLLSLAGDRLAMVQSLPENALEACGISAGDLKMLSAALEEFTANISKPRDRRQHIRSAKQRAEHLMNAALELMQDILDPVAHVLGRAHPDFSEAWMAARRVEDTGHRTRAFALHLLAAGSGAPVANAEIVLMPLRLHKRSTGKGNAQVQNLAAGAYTARVSHPDYIAKEVSFNVINGEAKVLQIALEPLIAA